MSSCDHQSDHQGLMCEILLSKSHQLESEASSSCFLQSLRSWSCLDSWDGSWSHNMYINHLYRSHRTWHGITCKSRGKTTTIIYNIIINYSKWKDMRSQQKSDKHWGAEFTHDDSHGQQFFMTKSRTRGRFVPFHHVRNREETHWFWVLSSQILDMLKLGKTSYTGL